MRFLHIADTHIGMLPDKGRDWSEQRRIEIMDSFMDIIHKCNEQSIDLLLIAGDLFHKQPLVRELKEVNSAFESLNSTRVVLIAGNHDYISAKSPYNGFEWSKNVTMLKSRSIESVYIEELNTQIYGFSYYTREVHEQLLKGLKPEHTDRINILLAHGGEGNSLPIDKKELSGTGFDYVALGHLHKHQDINERIRYSGSPEPLDKNENGEHGYISGELIKKGEACSELVTSFVACAKRQYIKADLVSHSKMTNIMLRDEVKKLITNNGEQNIFEITIKGYRDVDIEYEVEPLYNLGNIIEVVDESVPNYDFIQLEKENGDNLIGMFIRRIGEDSRDDETATKALYYGLEALIT